MRVENNDGRKAADKRPRTRFILPKGHASTIESMVLPPQDPIKLPKSRKFHRRISDKTMPFPNQMSDTSDEFDRNRPEAGESKGEKDPRQKPFELFLAAHGPEDIAFLKPWGRRIVSMIESRPTGKVAVVYEFSDGIQEKAEAIKAAVLTGKLPSEAYRDVLGFVANTEYNFARVKILDAISRRYPGRLYLTQEWQHAKLLRTPWTEWHIPPSNTDMTEAFLKREKEKAYLRAYFQKKRNGQIACLIKNALSQPDIIGGVGLIGSAHTPISHTLRKEGYAIQQVFPDKKQNMSMYSPLMTFDRITQFFPEREITTDEIRLALQGEQHALALLRKKRRNAQEVFAETHIWMRKKMRENE